MFKKIFNKNKQQEKGLKLSGVQKKLLKERKSLRQPLATLSSSAGAGPSTTSSNLNATLPLPVAQQPIGVGPDFGQLSKSDGYLGVNKENMDSAGQDVPMRNKKACRCCGCAQGKTHQYLLKKKNRRWSLVPLGQTNFLAFYEIATVLIDRSLFLVNLIDLCQINKNILISMPSGNGKTMIMGLAKAFFEDNPQRRQTNMEIFDKEFCLHNPKFAIMGENHTAFRQEHQGKHPIIHFNMADISGGFFGPNAIKYDISHKIGKLFDENSSMINAIDKAIAEGKLERRTGIRWKQQFEIYLSTIHIQMDQWKNALDVLIRILKWNSEMNGGGGLFVFVDEYDKLIYQNENLDEWNQSIIFIDNFLRIFLENDDIEMFLAFGRYKFPLENFNICAISVDEDRIDPVKQPGNQIGWLKIELAKSFGFRKEEFLELANSYNFKEFKVAENWYNGYALGSNPLFSCQSIIKMLCTDKFLPYFMEPHLMKNQFAPFFRSTEVATKINKMLNEEPVEIGENPINFGITEMKALLVHAKNYCHEDSFSGSDLFLAFLHSSGYIVRRGNEFHIPNEEMRRIFQQKIADFYYEHRYQVDEKYSKNVTNILRQILFSRDAITKRTKNGIVLCEKKIAEEGKNLKNALDELLNAAIIYNEGMEVEVGRSEHNFHREFEGAAYRLFGWNYFSGDLEMDGEDKKISSNRPDILICHKLRRVALCAELKWGNPNEFDKKAEFGLGQIVVQKYISGHPKVLAMKELDRIVAIGANMHVVDGKIDDGNGKKKKVKLANVELKMEVGQRKASENTQQFLRRFDEYLSKQYETEVNQYIRKKEAKKKKGKK